MIAQYSEQVPYAAAMVLGVAASIIFFALIGRWLELLGGRMYQFKFSYKMYDRKGGKFIKKGSEVFTDRGEGLAKDGLRLSLQTQYKSDTGIWPYVELTCDNSPVKNVGEC